MTIADNTFAAACYNQNSIAELEKALIEGPDAGDMKVWNLTADEWREEIELALEQKRQDEADADAEADAEYEDEDGAD